MRGQQVVADPGFEAGRSGSGPPTAKQPRPSQTVESGSSVEEGPEEAAPAAPLYGLDERGPRPFSLPPFP